MSQDVIPTKGAVRCHNEGRTLAVIRRISGLTQAQLAHRADEVLRLTQLDRPLDNGICESQVAHIERGARQPSYPSLVAIAAVLTEASGNRIVITPADLAVIRTTNADESAA